MHFSGFLPKAATLLCGSFLRRQPDGEGCSGGTGAQITATWDKLPTNPIYCG